MSEQLGSGREFDLIREFLANTKRRAHADVRVGPGDDCAVVGDFAISADMSVENVHFKRAWLDGEEIGHRAAAAALSDLAAMAAQPVAALLSFSFRRDDATGWAQSVMSGATRIIEEFGAMLVGGDITRVDGAVSIDVVVIGRALEPVLRSGARAGDSLWVTGSLGGPAVAVAAWQRAEEPGPAARARFAHPVPRVREARWLRERVDVHAMIDLSDGIAGDACHIAAASGCRLIIDAARLALDQDATIEQALRGGEDYELLFSAPAGAVEGVASDFERQFGVPLTSVGRVESGAGLEILNGPGGSGFDHFNVS